MKDYWAAGADENFGPEQRDELDPIRSTPSAVDPAPGWVLRHEAYLRLVDLSRVEWQDRAHFYAVCARVMRGILVDAARARNAQKRGGQLRRANPGAGFDIEQVPDLGPKRAAEILAINDTLDFLAKRNERQMQVVEMRFFGGLSVEETAEVLKISAQSVKRDWSLAKAWLRREMRRDAEGLGL